MCFPPFLISNSLFGVLFGTFNDQFRFSPHVIENFGEPPPLLIVYPPQLDILRYVLERGWADQEIRINKAQFLYR